MHTDTIAAIATAPGTAGIGIVRLSGPKACAIACRLSGTRISNIDYRISNFVSLSDPATHRFIDKGIVVFYHSPRSYTGEDVAELQCHGSPIILQTILKLCIKLGARLAEPGEFTRRAFENGKIDLIQAEAIADMIEAESELALDIARSQYEGHLSKHIDTLRQKLIDLLAEIEAYLDYPEEFTAKDLNSRIKQTIKPILKAIEYAIATADTGRKIKEGILVAIVGAPNVGKSTLLNALLGEERAIVTNVPGTTRDTIEETLVIKGIKFRLVDTAGLRTTKGKVERKGIERTQWFIEHADVVLHILDASSPHPLVLGTAQVPSPFVTSRRGGTIITIMNKLDLLDQLPLRTLCADGEGRCPASRRDNRVRRISAKTGAGLDLLKKALLRKSGRIIHKPGSITISNLRQKDRLQECQQSLQHTLEGIKASETLDLLTIHLRTAILALGEISGKQVTEAILESIFSRFCLGK